MTRYITLLATLLVCGAGLYAQDKNLSEAEILRTVELNCPVLKNIAATADAEMIQARTGNSLSDPQFDYTHTWGNSGAAGEDEFTLTQGFDFPTAYAQRNKAAKANAQVANANYQALRTEQLLSARLLVQEIIYLQKRKTVDSLRLNDALYAERIAQRRNEAGDITVIEENRTQIQLLSARNALARTQMALASALAKLSSMTCTPLTEDVSITAMPLPELPPLEQVLEKAYAADASLTAAKASQQAALMQRRLATSLALPKFSAGYKHSRSDGLNFNGLIVGMSIPIFESRHTVKLARARQTEAETSYESQHAALTTQIRAAYLQAQSLGAMRAFYAENRAPKDKAGVLKKALEAGQMGILEYFTELDSVYRNMEEWIEVTYNYNSLVIELDKYSL